MKKLAILLSVMIIILGLTACNSGGSTKATQAATQADTQAVTQAPTQAPTQAVTQAPTPAPTQAPTQPATFEAATAIVKQPSNPTDATSPTDENGNVVSSTDNSPQDPTADENGNRTLSGTILGMGGTTVVIRSDSGAECEFVYTSADISNSDGFTDGAHITVTYTGSVEGDNLGQAVTITVS